MGKLYLECNSGISGDMFVAALLDLGADQQVLLDVLATVPATGFSVQISRVQKAGLDACDFDVLLDAAHENHDHDMAFLHGHDQPHLHAVAHEHVHEHEHEHEHTHNHEHEHDHGHEHAHSHEAASAHGHHAHVHRGLADVLAIIDATHMTESARFIARYIFTILGRAEAKAHGTTLEEVHFHEVGAVDSIVDILSAAVCLDNLGITEVILPRLCEGQGTVHCAHGVLPIPVPAVSNIVAAHGLPLHIIDLQGELVTPTGAAIAAAIRTADTLPERFTIEKIGIGAGKRNYERPSLLRAMLITEPEAPTAQRDVIVKLEANLDDCTGEALGYAMDALLAAGARDVHYTPVFMKKNRPAYQLNVLCTPEDVSKMEEILFTQTTTIGVRRVAMERTLLPRQQRTVQTSLGQAEVKACTIGTTVRLYPEYRSVCALCEQTGLPFGDAYRLVQEEAYAQL